MAAGKHHETKPDETRRMTPAMGPLGGGLVASWSLLFERTRGRLANTSAAEKRVLWGGLALLVVLLSPGFSRLSQTPASGPASQVAQVGVAMSRGNEGSGGGANLPASQPGVPRSERDTPLQLETPSDSKPAGRDTLRFAGWLFGFFGKLAVVLALAYGSLFALKRVMRSATVVAADQEIGLRGSMALGPGQSLHLLEVRGRILLIGSTTQQVALLADLTGQAEEGDVLGVEAAGELAAEDLSFGAQLDAFLADDGNNAPQRRQNRNAARGSEAAAKTGATSTGLSQPELYTDEELREEVRRRLFSLNQSASKLQALREAAREGRYDSWADS